MLNTVRNAFRIKEIRQRLFYTFVMLVITRIGSQLPIPGVDREYFSNWFASQSQDAFSFFDAITGGSFLNMSILALNITPYITSSIIIQLLTIAIPKLEEMQKDGESGRKKMIQITRYLTVGLSVMQAVAIAIGFGRQGLLENYDAFSVITVVVALTAGASFLMWIGERITENGVGNGISIVLLFNIVSRLPNDFYTLYDQFIKGKNLANGALAGVIIAAVIIVTVVFVIILQDAERRIPVQYSRKLQGNRAFGAQSSTIPLKVNTAGVMPIIFAQSLLQTPVIIAQLLGKGNGTGIGSQILKAMQESNWCDPENLKYSIGFLVYLFLIIVFAYFYTSITFNPLEVADNMKKQGGFIPGIRPGKATSDYLSNLLNYIIFIGACGLAIVAFVPIFFNGVFKASVSFGGTSIIIIVGVVVETLKQIESQMLVRNYKGFLS